MTGEPSGRLDPRVNAPIVPEVSPLVSQHEAIRAKLLAFNERSNAPLFSGDPPSTAKALFDECVQLIQEINSRKRMISETAAAGIFSRWQTSMKQIGGPNPPPYPYWIGTRQSLTYVSHPIGEGQTVGAVHEVDPERLRQEAELVKNWCQARLFEQMFGDKRDKPEKRQKQLPDNADVVDLCGLLAKRRTNESLISIALRFTHGNKAKAASLLRQARRYRHLW